MKISVIVPVYNVERFLDKCLQSLRSQTYDDYEVIVVNDGSTDRCAQLLEKYEAETRFKIIHQDNIGLGGARNTGLSHAVGDYVVFVDSDDWVTDDFLTNLMGVEPGAERADVIVGRFSKVSEDGEEVLDLQPLRRNPPGHRLQPYQLVLGAFISSVAWGKAIRANLARSLPFDPSLPHEDLFFTYKLLLKAKSVAWRRKPTLFWRQRAGSLGRSADVRHARAAAELIHDTDKFLEAEGLSQDGPLASRRAVIVIDSIFKRLSPISSGSESETILLSLADAFMGKYEQASSLDFDENSLPTNFRAWIRGHPQRSRKPSAEGNHAKVAEVSVACADRYATRPQFSIITPSFNQSKYIEACLKSIHSQKGITLEHILYDGGSTDGSLDIIKKFKESHSIELHIGQDRSQSNAINLGFEKASGDIIAWLNTDDYYVDDTVLHFVHRVFEEQPSVDIVYCKGNFVSHAHEFIREAYIAKGEPAEFLFSSVGILQPALFMRRSVFQDIGPINENLRYAMDYEYWIRCAMGGKKFLRVDRTVCEAVLHQDSKTFGERPASLRETLDVAQSLYGLCSWDWCEKLAAVETEGADGIAITARTVTTELKTAANSEFGRRLAGANFLKVPNKVFSSEAFKKTALAIEEVGNADTQSVAIIVNNEAFASALKLVISRPDVRFYVFASGLTATHQRILAAIANCRVSAVDTSRETIQRATLNSIHCLLERVKYDSSLLLVDLTDPYILPWLNQHGARIIDEAASDRTTFYSASYLRSGVLPQAIQEEIGRQRGPIAATLTSGSIMMLRNDRLFKGLRATLSRSPLTRTANRLNTLEKQGARMEFWLDIVRFCGAEKTVPVVLESLSPSTPVKSAKSSPEYV